jgi:alpha-1,3/alpha-1,6-mannosyltransferase
LSTAVFSNELRKLDPDVIFVDQLSACIHLFRIFCPRAKILFYGHYLDRLLVKKEAGAWEQLMRIYRLPFDTLEGWSTSCSDGIVVNSKYTWSVFRSTFSTVRDRDLKVIYPCVDTTDSSPKDKSGALWPGKKIILSINRFEGKKNLDLAIKAYAGLTLDERKGARLVLAGGYNPRSVENSTTHKKLQDLANSLSLTHATFRNNDTSVTDMTTEDVEILFLLSIPQKLKHACSTPRAF